MSVAAERAALRPPSRVTSSGSATGRRPHTPMEGLRRAHAALRTDRRRTGVVEDRRRSTTEDRRTQVSTPPTPLPPRAADYRAV